MDDLERRFNGAMVSIYETAKRELGYNATRFVQMISEQGGLATAKQLLWSSAPSLRHASAEMTASLTRQPTSGPLGPSAGSVGREQFYQGVASLGSIVLTTEGGGPHDEQRLGPPASTVYLP